MNVLTEENKCFSMNLVNKKTKIFFAVLDYEDSSNPDYQWLPLYGMEHFSSPVAELRFGENIIQMPLDWNLLVGEQDFGEIEIIPILDLNERSFKAFCFNPMAVPGTRKGFIPKFLEVELTMVYPDIKWIVPKLKSKNLLSVPIEMGTNPDCVYFCKDGTKIPDNMDIGKII